MTVEDDAVGAEMAFLIGGYSTPWVGAGWAGFRLAIVVSPPRPAPCRNWQTVADAFSISAKTGAKDLPAGVELPDIAGMLTVELEGFAFRPAAILTAAERCAVVFALPDMAWMFIRFVCELNSLVQLADKSFVSYTECPPSNNILSVSGISVAGFAKCVNG